MKAFSIDLKNSAKGERKKAVKYLRGLGYKVQKKKNNRVIRSYLSNYFDVKANDSFKYFYQASPKEKILTLPQDWDKLIEYTKKELVPDKNSKFEIGKWYYSEKHAIPIRFDVPVSPVIPEACRIATEEEISNFLVEEAKCKGFVEDAKFTALRDTKRGEVNMASGTTCGNYEKSRGKIGDSWDYRIDTDTLYIIGYGRYVVYEKGEWAEIDKPISIGGYKLRKCKEKDLWNFGCYSFYECNLEGLIDRMETSEATSITIKGQEVTLEKLIEVRKYINENRDN